MYLRAISIVGLALLFAFLYQTVFHPSNSSDLRESRFDFSGEYPLFDPEAAPAADRDQVMRGYNILIETKKYLPEYAGDRISCNNCHFGAGNSFGGQRNGFSLVGVDHKFPTTLESGEEYTLADRINSCFYKSLNGKPLPVDHPDMQAMIAYIEWISHGIPQRTDYPWMGTKKLRTKHTPDPKNGALVYEQKCALCHGQEGQGQERPYDLNYPPLWGAESFNDGAGMHHVDVFAYFVYENMPYNDPKLTMEEALDVAAFVTSQDRPHFTPPDSSD